ncbi:MAG: thioesterase family protein [Ilumatobacteraceae bacterium]|nr:thioesterase family protein [Ilumatobacteraceae bacterium]
MPSEFNEAVSVSELGTGSYFTPIPDGWDIMGNANGGFLLARVANAMCVASGRNDPVSVTMHYLAPAPASDEYVTDVEVVKAGRTLSTVSASLRRGATNIARAIGSFGDVDAQREPIHVTMSPPDIPPVDDCVARRDNSPLVPALQNRLTTYLHPDDVGFATGNPPRVARMRGWLEFADGTPMSTLGLLLAADAFPPTLFNLFGMQGWVPTVELTVHVRAQPSPGPVQCVFTTHVVQGGMLEEDGQIWDSSGTCVALSRQIALAPRLG